jgi:hypothetical protein
MLVLTTSLSSIEATKWMERPDQSDSAVLEIGT